MGKIQVEICLISARGLRRTSRFLKLQWFAVGWIDPDNKYCTKIDSSGNAYPVWKMKFPTIVDPCDESKFQDLALRVEVYSREPIFLRKSLLGSATIVLKEFLDKYDSKSEVSKPVEEVGSFQLWKKNSNKHVGFVDVSIRVSEEGEEPASSSSYIGDGEGYSLTDDQGNINLASGYGFLQTPTPHLLPTTSQQSQNNHFMPFHPNYPYHYHPSGGANYPAATGPSHDPFRPPPPPPPPPGPPLPPSNVGFTPNFFPMDTNCGTSSYINMPSSVAPPGGHGARPGFGMGIGAGALAAGAVIFGDNITSGFDVTGASGDANVTISAYPSF